MNAIGFGDVGGHNLAAVTVEVRRMRMLHILGMHQERHGIPNYNECERDYRAMYNDDNAPPFANSFRKYIIFDK